MSKVFLYSIKHRGFDAAHALGDDGTMLVCQAAKNTDNAKRILQTSKDYVYRSHFPNGYEMEWIEASALDDHVEFQAAFGLFERVNQ